MQRTWIALTLLVLSLLVSAQASAQETFYGAGEINVALERGFGVHYVHRNIDPPGGDDFDWDGTTIGLGWYGALTPLHWARGAFDVFVIDQLSIGGSLGFYAQSGDPDGDGLIIAPRVGYAIPLSDLFTFWPRGGISYYDQDDNNLFALSGEAMFVLTPHPNWGILLGATLDIGVAGNYGDDTDFTEIALGIPSIGILGNF